MISGTLADRSDTSPTAAEISARHVAHLRSGLAARNSPPLPARTWVTALSSERCSRFCFRRRLSRLRVTRRSPGRTVYGNNGTIEGGTGRGVLPWSALQRACGYCDLAPRQCVSDEDASLLNTPPRPAATRRPTAASSTLHVAHAGAADGRKTDESPRPRRPVPLPDSSFSVSVAADAPGVAGRPGAYCVPTIARAGASATGEDRRAPRNAGRAAPARPRSGPRRSHPGVSREAYTDVRPPTGQNKPPRRATRRRSIAHQATRRPRPPASNGQAGGRCPVAALPLELGA
jgi:hypothetical protein